MKIGFDAKRAVQNRTGLGNYSRFVIDALAAYTDGNEYFLYAPKLPKTGVRVDVPATGHLLLPASPCWKMFRSLWRVWGVTTDIVKDKVELYHGLSNELPLNISRARATKSIVTIHDLIFLRYPAYYKFIDRLIYTYKFRKACQHSDCIIAVSECTKRDIISFFHIPEEKIEVVYQGCDAQFKHPVTAATKEEIRKKYQLPQQYILCLGSIESRKNLLLLAKALKHLQTPVSVIAIGKRTPYADTVESFLKENHLENKMRLLSNIPFKELPAFYQMAATFVYPSFFEGFGIPLLEALNSGTPVIGATGSCLEEAGGTHSLYVHPQDEKALAAAIDRTLTDDALRKEMIEEGHKFAARFEGKVLTEALIKVYQKTLVL
ncbi:MAG: glycosyltransferase family 1 protein [Bacteroides sp.]